MSTTSVPEPTTSARASWLDILGLGLAAALLGAATSIGVWLFNQAFNALYSLAFTTIGGALQPIGAWTIALIPAIGGIGLECNFALVLGGSARRNGGSRDLREPAVPDGEIGVPVFDADRLGAV
jgi:hypothetical protein